MWLCRRHEPSNQIARWLEILSEFKYTTEHRKGERHGNADGLSQKACAECKQCERIEKRDGGPSHEQIAAELRGEVDLQCAGSLPETALEGEVDLQCAGSLPEIAQIEQSTTPGDLKKLQSEGDSPVATMYRALEKDEPVTDEQLAVGSRELRQLHQRRHSLRLSLADLLEI